MTITINDSFLTEKALDYAKLSSLAYAIWENGALKYPQDGYNDYRELWSKLYDKGYRFVAYCPNDPNTGYSGTIFYNKNTQTYILANRGTEASLTSFEADYNDLKADTEILNGFTPAEQFTSMMEFIAQNNLNMYQFDVTGHSLGGCLAQMAKATYSGNVDEVYTYNAPGAKELKQNYFFKGLSATPGMVVVEYFQGTVWIETEWKQENWDLYQTFLNNKPSVSDNKVYNILGKDWLKTIANWKPDIGGEVFINGAWHGIESVIKSLETNKYYIDSRRLMPVIGSKANELFDARYSSGHYPSTPQKITIVGGYGNDTIYGGDGGNKIFGDLPDGFEDPNGESGNTGLVAGNDSIIGGAGDDTIYGGAGNNTIWGLYGNDYIVGGYDKDVIYGGSGNDSIWGGDGLNTIYGDAGNDQIVGGADSDFINGGIGNDTIWGEGGNDKIYNGGGSDTLYGGAGNDTYYIEADGSTSKIEDKQGTNILYIGKRIITDFRWDASDLRYESRDGQVVGSFSGSDFIVTYAGTTVILNENFAWGDFGIDEITLPTAFSTPNPPITGDLTPILTAEGEYQYNQWGNVIVDSDQPAPGRSDALYDTSGDDLILGGGGDDHINTVHGGSDKIQGGPGNDLIAQKEGDIPGARGTLYNSIIEGGTGSDIILGHYTVSNQLFGDSYGEMSALIAHGDEAPDNELKGDFISDYYLPEYGQTSSAGYLYGSDGRDILINNTGMGVIVGGDGNDLIYGGKIILFRRKLKQKNKWRKFSEEENLRRLAA